MSWYLDIDNQLNHVDLAVGISGDIFQNPYPASFWNFEDVPDVRFTINDEDITIMIYPIVDASSGRNDNLILTAPYPASFWYLTTNRKIDMDLISQEIPGAILVPNYPASLWWYDGEKACIWMFLQGDPLPLGAFSNCLQLETVKIPKTVKSLGDESFKNTSLVEVTIANDCKYNSKDTFPPGCEINHYNA